MSQPVRLRLSRAKGFDLQAASRALNGLPAINVARPGPLGNPFVVGQDGDRAYCVELHRYLCCGLTAMTRKASVESQHAAMTYIAENLKALRNRNVACWCGLDQLCHGDTLLELFNRPEPLWVAANARPRARLRRLERAADAAAFNRFDVSAIVERILATDEPQPAEKQQQIQKPQERGEGGGLCNDGL